MFELDIRTLIIITMLFSLIFSFGVMHYALHNRRFYGLRLYAYGYFLLFAGCLLMALRNLVPDSLSVVSANTAIAVSFFLFTAGAYSFLKRRLPVLWIHILAIAVLAGGFSYFTFFVPLVYVRVIIISVYVLGETIISAVLFLMDGTRGFRVQKNSAAAGYILISLFSLIRIVYTLFTGGIDDFLNADLFQGLSFLFVQIFIINTSFSLLWITAAMLNEDLDQLAKIDPLTKILNRRAFLEELSRELARSRRGNLTFSLIMADIDHFKKINDTFGHLAGDSVLIGFTSIVRVNLRINDIVARFGGEEFFILLPETEKKQAVETAERIRKIICEIKHPFNGKEISYTVSFGVTSFNIDAQNREELLENVDMALYEAKTKGRNRVEMK